MPLISSTIPNLIGGVSQQPYTVRLASQCEAMENFYPSIVEFLRRRPATRHIAKILNGQVGTAAAHVINRDDVEQYVIIAVDGTLKVFTLDGAEVPVSFPEGRGYLATDTPDLDLSFLTIADYTFVLNKAVTVAMDEATTEQRPPEALVFIKQASYATDYSIILDGEKFTHTTLRDDSGGSVPLRSTTIANDLMTKIKAKGGYFVELVKSTIHIRKADGSEFTVAVEDSRSNSHMSMVTDRVQKFSDLLTVAPDGYTCEVVGEQGSDFDNYYVKFAVSNLTTPFGQGEWRETVKPGIPYKIKASTMPHALVREADGTFSFKPLEWGERACGDEDSAPEPSFIGRTLSSIFFYRNRLGLLSRENCILSEAGEFFNFFVTTAQTLVDSDIIDVAATQAEAGNLSKVTDLHHACSFSEGLILFSSATQFILEHDDNLSVKTVAVRPITGFECSTRAQPVGAGKNIFFAADRGAYAGVREYFVEQDTSLTDAADITSHVPHYIPGKIHKLLASTNEDCLLALSTQERRYVNVYKYFWNGQEKLQSSWCKWGFSGDVISAAFLNSVLLLVIRYDDGLYLERLNIEPGYTDIDGAPFEYYIDRKVTEEGLLFITYDAALHQSTITFPYPLSGSPLVVSRHHPESEHSPPGIIFTTLSWSGNTAVVEGDCRDTPLFAGIPFTSSFLFSRQVMREDAGSGSKTAVAEGRLQLRYFTFTYGDTGYFSVLVTPAYRPTVEHVFPGRVLGQGDNIIGDTAIHSGVFRVGIMSNAEAVSIALKSDSFLPMQITSAGWEGYYHIRSRRT